MKDMRAQKLLAITLSILFCLTGCTTQEEIINNAPAESNEEQEAPEEISVPEMETDVIQEPFDKNTEIETIKDDPVFGSYGRLLFPVDDWYMSGSTLGDLQLTWYNNIDPEETVEKILAVSAKLFMEKGYEHTTLQDIIDNLGGLTKGAIYHHFKGKEEILLAIADRMGEQTEAWMRTVRDDPGLTGAEKLQKMFRASLENSDQTDLFVLAPNMLKNPKLMSILLESMIGEVLPNYMEPVLREAVADGSIRTDYPEELGELLLLLSNVWLNPMIYPATPEKTRRRMELYDQMLRSMGLDLLDQELLNQWERFCRLSQERL